MVTFLLTGFGPASGPRAGSQTRLLELPVFKQGERLQYRVHYGFINAGEATLSIHKQLWEVADRACYRVEINGRSSSAFDKFVKIRNVWGTYIDTGAYKPILAYRDIQENKYRLKEDVKFDYQRDQAIVQRKDTRDTTYKITDPVQDIVSGYYF